LGINDVLKNYTHLRLKKTKLNIQWRATSASGMCQMEPGAFSKESSYFRDVIFFFLLQRLKTY